MMAELLAHRADSAMVSRVRVDVRGGSMEDAEHAAFEMLEQFLMLAKLEGWSSGTGEWSDHHFFRPEVTSKREDEPEAWTELGLPYVGRLAFTFEPGVQSGGVPQGEDLEVTDVDGEVVTDTVIVLGRKQPLAPEYVTKPTDLGTAIDVMLLSGQGHNSALTGVVGGSIQSTATAFQCVAGQVVAPNLVEMILQYLGESSIVKSIALDPRAPGSSSGVTLEYASVAAGDVVAPQFHRTHLGRSLEDALEKAYRDVRSEEGWVAAGLNEEQAGLS